MNLVKEQVVIISVLLTVLYANKVNNGTTGISYYSCIYGRVNKLLAKESAWIKIKS